MNCRSKIRSSTLKKVSGRKLYVSVLVKLAFKKKMDLLPLTEENTKRIIQLFKDFILTEFDFENRCSYFMEHLRLFTDMMEKRSENNVFVVPSPESVVTFSSSSDRSSPATSPIKSNCEVSSSPMSLLSSSSSKTSQSPITEENDPLPSSSSSKTSQSSITDRDSPLARPLYMYYDEPRDRQSLHAIFEDVADTYFSRLDERSTELELGKLMAFLNVPRSFFKRQELYPFEFMI